MKSYRSREFKQRLEALPRGVQLLASENFLLWKTDTSHPSLHFKKLTHGNWSVRIGIHYRGVGRFVEDGFLWEWIGTHADYDRLA